MSKIIYKLSHGMYIVTTNGGGCVVDAVSQVSGGNKPLVSIAVMKSNYTNELLHNNDELILSILSKKVDGSLIEKFGFHSMRDYDKFENIDTFNVAGIKVPKDIIGYMKLKIIDRIDNDTHTLFITEYVSGEQLNEEEEMTYNYYREHKEEYIKVKTENNKVAWICTVCGYVYYGDELPKDFKCPVCGVDASYFKKQI